MPPTDLWGRPIVPKKSGSAPPVPRPAPRPAYVGPAQQPAAVRPVSSPAAATFTGGVTGGSSGAPAAAATRRGGNPQNRSARQAQPARPTPTAVYRGTQGEAERQGQRLAGGPARPATFLPGQTGAYGGRRPATTNAAYAGETGEDGPGLQPAQPAASAAAGSQPAGSYEGPVYATSQYGEVFGPSADMPVGARFKWYVDNGVPIPPYLETAGLSQPGGPGTAVYFNDGSYVRYDDRAVGGPGYGAPDNPATWLRQMRQEAAARRATYPGPAAEVEEPVLGSTEYGSF